MAKKEYDEHRSEVLDNMKKEYEELNTEALNILKTQGELARIDAMYLINPEQAEKCSSIIDEFYYGKYDYGIKGIVDTKLPWSPLDRVAMIKNLGKVFDIDMSINEAAKIDEAAINTIFAKNQDGFLSETGRIFWGSQSGELTKAVGWMAVYMLVNTTRKAETDMSGFDKVIGYDEVKNDLKRYADFLKNPERYEKYGVSLPGGILLYGEMGLGKTLLAECFVAETGLEAYTIRKDKPDGEFVSYITDTFDKAAEAENGAVILLDDLDKFANEDSDHRNAEEYITVQSCIDKYMGKGVFVIATANDIDLLPLSLIRSGRLDKKYELDFPQQEEAEKILGAFLKKYTIDFDVDVRELSRLMGKKSCADYKEVVNEAGIYAAYEGRDSISNMDIVKAFMRLTFDAPESMSDYCTRNDLAIAIHEAGHVVVGEILDPGSITAVSILHRINKRGSVTLTCSPSEITSSYELRTHRIISGLAGKASTEVVTGEPDLGCSNDIQCVISQLETMIEDYCVKDFDVFWRAEPSDDLLRRKERMISAELDRFYKEAKKILIENRPFLNAILDALLEKKILLQKDIQEIKIMACGELWKGP